MNTPTTPEAASCARCLKSDELCVCAGIKPLKTRLEVLILQHPQEPDKELGTAQLAHLALTRSTLRIGLSWPNLKAALGQRDRIGVQPSRWAVLYLGSGVRQGKGKEAARASGPSVRFVDRKGDVLVRPPVASELDGLVVLDGTWSQAKALWWRNAWLLKLRRAILEPQQKSLYRELRREPRRECLSTIESVAEALCALGESPDVGRALRATFARLLERKRGQAGKS